MLERAYEFLRRLEHAIQVYGCISTQSFSDSEIKRLAKVLNMKEEEVRYGMLMMVLCDREGRVYVVWITFGSVHEVRAFRERKKRSLWFRGLVMGALGLALWGCSCCQGPRRR